MKFTGSKDWTEVQGGREGGVEGEGEGGGSRFIKCVPVVLVLSTLMEGVLVTVVAVSVYKTYL